MNKKAQFLPIIAILSIFLVGYAFYVLIILGPGSGEYFIGEHSTKWLVMKEVKLKEIDFYYEQAFKNAIFKTVSEITENGAGKRDLIWDENPYLNVKMVFKNTLEKNFKFYLDKTDFSDNNYYKNDFEIILPKNFEINLDDGKVSLEFKDELILKDRPLDEDYLSEEPSTKTYEDNFISVSKKLKYEYQFESFRLTILDRIYNEFSKSNKCITVSDDFRSIKCVDECIVEKSRLDYEIPLERVGFVIPIVKFKIPKQC
ncbi:hypothetical protein HY498_00180 [Candidatus Woesearchaeota archaeon]|nr:hypothetical protein [Candidatus Woesearchaeota archaeon]